MRVREIDKIAHTRDKIAKTNGREGDKGVIDRLIVRPVLIMREQNCREEDEDNEAGRQVQKDLGCHSHCLTRLGWYRLLGGIIAGRLTLLIGFVFLIGPDKHAAEKFTQLRQQDPVHRDAYEGVEDHQNATESVCRSQIAISCIVHNK